MERMLSALFSFLKKNAVIFYAGIGMGVYRCALEWPVWYNNTISHLTLPQPFSIDDFFLLIDIGKIMGALSFLVLCYAFDRKKKSGALLVLPSLIVFIGFLCPLLTGFGMAVSETMIALSLILIGVGIGMLFAQWIEFCGFIPPVKVIQVLALSYVVRFLLFPLITDVNLMLSAILIMILAGTSFAQVSLCFRKVVPAETWERKLPNKKSLSGYGSLFIWVGVFAFAYGLGESFTHLAHSTFEAGLGKVLPSLFILVLAFKLEDRFDRNILYAIALPLMTAGLIGIVFLGTTLSLSQVLVSAAFSSFHLLAYTTICSRAYQSRISSMFSGVCVRVIALITADIAVCLVRLNPTWDWAVFTTVTIAATIIVGILTFLPQIRNYREYYQFDSDKELAEQKRLEALAVSANLSQREKTVFLLLVEGRSSTEISEELFISNGAVRAHCSRIYDKFGVHSRKDFDALFL